MKSIQIKAPAKINIGLKITGKRLDGYHNLLTLFYPLHDLFDLITFRKSNSYSFNIKNDSGELKKNNVIIKAISLLEKYTGKSLKVDIELEKNIPVGGGMGGGSSDAAATLISLNELFRLNVSDDLLYGIALELGSDVSFFIKSKPAIGKSRGEVLQLIDFIIKFPVVIINPGIHISTKSIFDKISNYSSDSDFNIKTPESINDLYNWELLFPNDFENIVFEKYPEVASIKNKLYENNAGFASMTGTGSTVFGIFNDIETAENVLKIFPDHYYKFISHPQEELM